jgi:hypothetical protein
MFDVLQRAQGTTPTQRVNSIVSRFGGLDSHISESPRKRSSGNCTIQNPCIFGAFQKEATPAREE